MGRWVGLGWRLWNLQKINKKFKSKNHTIKYSVYHTQTKDMKTGGKGGLSRKKRFGSSGMRERNGEKK